MCSLTVTIRDNAATSIERSENASSATAILTWGRGGKRTIPSSSPSALRWSHLNWPQQSLMNDGEARLPIRTSTHTGKPSPSIDGG
ncbi:MAG: hypothetical protein IPG74_15510 [Flavobacteriales bacterium]|nr:hypothetical protein [Flavobacteriales bacterium]